MLAVLAIAVFALLVFASTAHAASKAIPLTTIEGYASQIAGQPEQIACDSPAGQSGSNDMDGLIHLAPSICISLEQMRQTSRLNTLSGFAMLTLQHEATHSLLNSGDEGEVECSAVQNRFQLVRLFKLPARWTKQIMAWELDAHDAITAPAYRTVC